MTNRKTVTTFLKDLGVNEFDFKNIIFTEDKAELNGKDLFLFFEEEKGIIMVCDMEGNEITPLYLDEMTNLFEDFKRFTSCSLCEDKRYYFDEYEDKVECDCETVIYKW